MVCLLHMVSSDVFHNNVLSLCFSALCDVMASGNVCIFCVCVVMKSVALPLGCTMVINSYTVEINGMILSHTTSWQPHINV